MAQALENVRVLDLSRFIAGPLCATLLADMGADVVKVERPGGEDTRELSPAIDGTSIYTLTYNRNKRAITLNSRSDRGKELLAGLVSWADVVVENFRPGTMDAMGFGWTKLTELNPDIILTSLSGFGQTGPYRDRALFDALAQAMSGLMRRNGYPGDRPLMTGMFLADCLTAVFGAYGTVVALYHRELGGHGQIVDCSLLDSLFACLGTVVPAYAMTGVLMPRSGNRDPFAAPANLFEACDGSEVYLNAGTDSLFARLTQAMANPELLTDPRFVSQAQRVAHTEEIEGLVGEWVGRKPGEEICDVLNAVGVPCGIAADIPDVIQNAQLLAREMVVSVVHPRLGTLTIPGIPVKLSETPGSIRIPPPLVGEHNYQVYGEILGLDKSEVDELAMQGVI